MTLVLNKTQKFDVSILVIEKEISSSLISIPGLLKLLLRFSIMSTVNGIILIMLVLQQKCLLSFLLKLYVFFHREGNFVVKL